ncbi:MAG: THUMP domain-containing protein [Desulfurococcales archaeon]|nr:THUMP domain-containing protein [Desulfurococcales archaeon]
MAGALSGLEEVNLLVTHLPVWGGRRLALEDLRTALRGRVRLVASHFNVLLLSVDYEDPLEAVEDLRRGLPRDTVVLRAIPVHRIVAPPEVEDVARVVKEILSRAPPGSFAVRLEGRLLREGREISRDEAVKVLADPVDRPVNLSNPDILVLVKRFRLKRLVGAAIYVGPPRGVLSTAKGEL